MIHTSFASFKMLKCPTELFRGLMGWECVSNAGNVKQDSAKKAHVSSLDPLNDGKKKNFTFCYTIDYTAEIKYCEKTAAN